MAYSDKDGLKDQIERLEQRIREIAGGGLATKRAKRARRSRSSQKREFTDSEWLQHTAVHEAGHAVMAVHFGFPLGSISIESDGFYAGITHTPEAGEVGTAHPEKMFGLEKEIIVLMAGTEAVKAALPKLAGLPSGDCGDLDQIDHRVYQLCLFTEEKEDGAKRRLRNMTGYFMIDPAIQGAVLDVANKLLEKKTVAGGVARNFVEGALKKYHRKHYPNRPDQKNHE